MNFSNHSDALNINNKVLHKSVIKVQIGGHDINALLDTGSTYSICDEKLVQKLKIRIGHLQENDPRFLLAANSSKMNILGRVDLNIRLLGIIVPHVAYVMPGMAQELLLGLEFMTQTGAVIRFDDHEVSFYRDFLRLPLMRTNEGFNQVKLVQTCVLEPLTETMVSVKLPKNFNGKQTVIIEPATDASKSSFLVSRSLHKIRGKNTMLRILNPNLEQITLNRGLAVASYENIDNNCIVSELVVPQAEVIREADHLTNRILSMPPDQSKPKYTYDDLKIKIDETNLTEGQKQGLRDFVTKNGDCWAKSMADLPPEGTPVITHRIPLIPMLNLITRDAIRRVKRRKLL